MSIQRYRSQSRNSAWNLLSLIAFAGLGSRFVACNSGDTVDGTTGNTAAVTNGTGNEPTCEGGQRDGFCDALSADPESCACLDCAQTAYCKQLCKPDGKCDVSGGEDCTCIDCIGMTVNMQDCQLHQGDQGQGPGPTTTAPATTTGSGTTTATTVATTAATTAATTGGAGGGTAASTSTGN